MLVMASNSLKILQMGQPAVCNPPRELTHEGASITSVVGPQPLDAGEQHQRGSDIEFTCVLELLELTLGDQLCNIAVRPFARGRDAELSAQHLKCGALGAIILADNIGQVAMTAPEARCLPRIANPSEVEALVFHRGQRKDRQQTASIECDHFTAFNLMARALNGSGAAGQEVDGIERETPLAISLARGG